MATVEATLPKPVLARAWNRRSGARAAEMLVGGLVFLFVLQVSLGYNITEPRLWVEYQRNFLLGTLRTLGYIVLALPVSLGVGFVIGWIRISRYRTLAWPATVYVEFFRGMPPIVIIIFASVLGPSLFPDRFQSAGLGLTLGAISIALHSGAFQSEIFRAGFQSVSAGQIEAALAVGMESRKTMFHVILPQALRLSLPPLSNEFAVLIKDTSLMMIIAGGELFHLSVRTQENLLATGGELRWLFAIWTAVAIAYFVMTFIVTRVMRLIELKFHARGLEAVSL